MSIPDLTQFKDITLPALLEKYPQVKPVLEQYNLLAYAQTETAQRESVLAAALVNQIDVDGLMAALVKVVV